uniref:Lipoprotein n=1 Tax=viral metagenome TaxID=1070528 RepID=A0A6M3J758_9ZZZZ
MKRLVLIMVVLFFLFGCAPRFTIPDEPKYKDMYAYPIQGAVCFDKEGWDILSGNILLQKEYAEKLKKILEDLKK